MAPKPKRLTKAAAKAKAEKEAAEFAAAEEAAAATLLAAADEIAAAAARDGAAAPDGVPPGPEAAGDLPDLPHLPPEGHEGEPEGEPQESEHDSDSDKSLVLEKAATTGSTTKVVKGKGKKSKKRDPVLLTDEQEIALFDWLKGHPELYSKKKNYRYVKGDVKKDLWDSVAADYDKTGKFYVIFPLIFSNYLNLKTHSLQEIGIYKS